jgi:hypothetical protein
MGIFQSKQQPAWRDTFFLQEQKSGSDMIDQILEPFRPVMKEDYLPYRNHCQRVYQFALYLMPKPTDMNDFKKIAICLAFHDLGIWTDSTVDYIDPSRKLAMNYLDKNSLTEWKTEIDSMVDKHHQFLQGTIPDNSLTEVIRKADLVDFSCGLVKHGVSKEVIRQVQSNYANAGFHFRLLQLASAWFLRHPLNPAPMLRWSS